MVKRTGPQTLVLRDLIRELTSIGKKNKVKLWLRIAKDLSRPTRIRRAVNLYKIDKHTREGETALVPGKVLSVGDLTKNLTIAAYQFSDKAEEKINKNGKAIKLQELLKNNPEGKKVRIIG
ncbi:MAG: 50S ribosomal protein L18e [Nanoarchaeota archaeon]|nr:50S ribosomal protein L18e [Nanoarchaeota archaeon]|tara:strand:+ start:702 stop:1064 length:363 start_codon:yes stop_codon:yes gene_type:complete